MIQTLNISLLRFRKEEGRKPRQALRQSGAPLPRKQNTLRDSQESPGKSRKERALGGRDHSEEGDSLLFRAQGKTLHSQLKFLCNFERCEHSSNEKTTRLLQGMKTSIEYQFHDLAQDPKEGEGAYTHTP